MHAAITVYDCRERHQITSKAAEGGKYIRIAVDWLQFLYPVIDNGLISKGLR